MGMFAVSSASKSIFSPHFVHHFYKNMTHFLRALLVIQCAVVVCNGQTKENLGALINSEYNEISPVISPDGKTLFFARVSHPQNTFGSEGSQDIWYAESQNNQWTLARRLGNPLNREQYNSAYSITPDGNTLLIHGAYNNGVYETRGFSLSKRTAAGWGAPQKIAVPGLEKMSAGQFQCGYLSVDGKTLVMSFSEKKNSREDNIYVSFKNKEGVWSKPTSLGEQINTEFTETTPFLAADGTTLFFSSDRPNGQGSNDIYYTKRLDKSWKKWSKPQNLGAAINTTGYDAYYTIAAAGDYAYMTSKNESLGKNDLVRVKLKGDPGGGQQPIIALLPAPDPVVMMSGKVINQKTGKPIEAKIVIETLPDGEEVGTATSSPNTGEYKVILPKGGRYSIRAVAKDFVAEALNIDLTDSTKIKEFQELINQGLTLVPIEVGQKVRMNNTFFETGKAAIAPESYPELDRIILTMTENSNLQVELAGHTDNVGKDDDNLKLSQDRADSVREYFIGKGVEPDRVASKGYGESRPVATNDTDEGRKQNRRVEFVILKK